MGQLIQFYIPFSFHFPQRKWMPESKRGKLLDFKRSAQKSAS
jgi:hypothetical protein